MSFRGASLLQFDELKELIASFAGSASGKERVLSCDTNDSRAAAEADLSEAGEAIAYLRDAAQPQSAAHGATIRLRFDQLRDLSGILRLLRVEGARLDGLEILDVFHVLSISGEYRAVLASSSGRYPQLARRAQSLIDLRDLVRRHQRAFLPDGSLADEASVALGRIRRDVERQQRGIQQSLERFLRSHRGDG
ncbi:MAG: endonuclease MutS2, partial [Bryobacteraceae bacterium]